MLISMSLTNFRSYKDEQTLDLVASKKLGKKSPRGSVALPGVDEHALRIAALYGANGSGKSNLIKALSRLKSLIIEDTPPRKPIALDNFQFDDETRRSPTCIEVRFLEQGEIFQYGVCADKNRVHEEWLDVLEGGKERNLFARTTSRDNKVIVELGPAAQISSGTSKIKALAEVGARPNQLFLTKVVELDDAESQGPRFHHAIHWFDSTLSVISPDASHTHLLELLTLNKQFTDFAGRFLQKSSTGISSLDTLTQVLPREQFLEGAPSFVPDMLEQIDEDDKLVIKGPNSMGFFVHGADKTTVNVSSAVALHRTTSDEDAMLPLFEESDGTRRLLNLLPSLYNLGHGGGVFVIDELERSMHPALAKKFIEYFLKAHKSGPSQLLFSTHETHLLDQDLLRRDGIWFTEKDEQGATHLYSLADFKVRKDLRLAKGYLQGRFGAIPFLGGLDELIEKAEGDPD